MMQVLTTKEREILICVVKGKLNKEIGNELSIALDTVKKHTANIYKKLQVRNRSEAIVWCINLQNKN